MNPAPYDRRPRGCGSVDSGSLPSKDAASSAVTSKEAPTAGASPTPKTVKLRQWQLDGYQPIGRIANGGMAEVWLARHVGSGGFERLVAVKRLHAHHSAQKAFVDMFLHEARLAAFIHHPNVVAIHEMREVDRSYYIVMDYVEGPTLNRLGRKASAAQRFIPPRIITRVMLDTLSGLHAAHEVRNHYGEALQLIHRDCTPQNILVGVEGSAQLTDFGVARAAARLDSSKDGTLKGKLSYMAPEQATETELDRRADLFSVGALLWELYAGERLFQGETEAGTLAKVLRMEIPTLRQKRDHVPAEIDVICRRSLARAPTERFATALEMAEAIERVALANEGIATRREVAALIDDLVGPELARRRYHIRNWIQATPTIPPPPAAGATSATFALPPADHAMSQIPPPVQAKTSAIVDVPPLELPVLEKPPRRPTRRSATPPPSDVTEANLFGERIKRKSRKPRG
jgi:serine/threonine-protein kinase